MLTDVLHEQDEKQAELLRSILDCTSDGVVVVDKAGEVVLFNPAAAELIKIKEGERLGLRARVFLPEDETTPFPADELPSARAIRGEETSAVEVFLRNEYWPQGIYLSVSGRPLYDEDGRARGGVVSFHDITKYRQALAKAREAYADMLQFAHIAAHDLQSPLATISGFAGLLRAEYGDAVGDEGREYIGFLVDEAESASRKVEGLLTFSRVGTKGDEFTMSDLNEVLERVLRALAAEIKERGAVVTKGMLPVVRADEVQIERVLQNLMSNAMKFKPPEQFPVVHVSAKKEAGSWIICVADRGIGIEERFFDKAFYLLGRVQGGEDYPGDGIGLAVSKRIIERHGGRMWIESEVGVGSKFFFKLPE